MHALSFLEKHGRDAATAVALKAGTNWPYFSQIAHGHRRPSVDLAHKLVAASAEVYANPEDQLDLVSLLQPRDRAA